MAVLAYWGPFAVNVVAGVAHPLRAAGRGQRLGQPAPHHGFGCALAFFDCGHDGQGAGIGGVVQQIAQGAPRAGEIFGGQMQFGLDQLGFAVLGVQLGQCGKAFDPLLGRFIGRNRGKCSGQIGVWLGLPRLFNHPRRIFGIALRDIGARGENRRWDQIGRLAVCLDRGFAGGNIVAIIHHALGLGQGQNGIAAFVHIARQGAGFQLGCQSAPRTGPIFCLRLQLQQRVLGFAMFGLKRQRLFGQLPCHIGFAVGQLLAHDAPHANKPGGIAA